MGIIIIPKRFILILLFFCELIVCKRIIPSSGSGGVKSDKLNECRRCKVLTDSFRHWLDKTSRGKYEGGDAAWEESKLKSYSRSEIRLVEIQEGLCSELKVHQDPCYVLAEESEQMLEQWWFREDSNSLDLYTWLCIETLQHCCPSNHFGETCAPCPLSKNNKVCSGNGRCDGDGTRKGNGTCICRRGYTGRLCEECAGNYYATDEAACRPCHRSCNSCTDEGATACVSCRSGWELVSGVCMDIDECSSTVCKPNQYCVNTEGSYICKECDLSCKTCNGEGSSNCTSCEDKDTLWSGMCMDGELKHSILNNAFKRLALYVGLLIITYFILRTSRSLASVVVLIIAIYIYFSESNLNINLLDVILNLLYVSS